MYVKTVWIDDETPISSTKMNKIEQGLYELLLVQDIVGTIQTPTYTGSDITSIAHTNISGGALVRTDTYVYTSELITEVRTLVTGETLISRHYFNLDGSYNRTEVS